MAPTDDRYLDATPEQMITAFWAHHYDDRRQAGKADGEEFEDEDFDADEVIRAMETGGEDWLSVLDDQRGEA